MPQVAKNAGATWDALAPAAASSASEPGRHLRRARTGQAVRPAAYAGPVTAQPKRSGTAQPDVATRLRRASCAPPSSRSSAGIGFLIAYFYVADFFRQYAAALALAGLAAVTVFQSLGLYNMAALSAAHRQLPRC